MRFLVIILLDEDLPQPVDLIQTFWFLQLHLGNELIYGLMKPFYNSLTFPTVGLCTDQTDSQLSQLIRSWPDT